MREHEQMRRELLIDQAIRKQLDALVSQANKTASELDPAKSSSRAQMEESQFRNVLSVAMETRSIEVVVNFIRYQIARPGSAWGNNDFGHKVILDLSGIPRESSKPDEPCIIGKLTDTVIEEVKAIITIEADVRDEIRATVAVRLMQLYLGYLGRAFYYAKKTDSFERLLEVANV